MKAWKQISDRHEFFIKLLIFLIADLKNRLKSFCQLFFFNSKKILQRSKRYHKAEWHTFRANSFLSHNIWEFEEKNKLGRFRMFGKLTRLYIVLRYCYDHERFFLCICISTKHHNRKCFACKEKFKALKARFKNIK